MKIYEIAVRVGEEVRTENVLGFQMCFVHEYAEQAYVKDLVEAGQIVFLNITQLGVSRPDFLATSYGLEESDCPPMGHCHDEWCRHERP